MDECFVANNDNSESRKLRAAVIGIGAMGKNHVRVYSEIEGVELVAIADSNQVELEKLGRKYKIKTYTDYKEMIAGENLDIISIVVPTMLHHRLALDCLNAKINVLVEKPIALNVTEAREIIETAEKNGVKLTIGHIERFNPAVQELKQRINLGAIGKVYEIVVKRIGPFPARIRDVGVVIDLAVHDIDIMRYLLDTEPMRIYAETEKRIHTDHEDLLCAMIKFRNDVICNLDINWLTPLKKRKIYVTGENGMFTVDYINQDLIFHENSSKNKNGKDDNFLITEGRMIKYHIHKKEPLRLELEHFVNCVLNNTEPLVSGEDGLRALELANKIIESANKNEVVRDE